jgi:transposase
MPKRDTSRRRIRKNNNRPNKYKKPSNLTKGKIVAFFEDGKSQRQIAEIVKVPRETVRDIIKLYKETKDIKRRVGSGRKRKTTKREDRTIVQMSRTNPFMSAQEISDNVKIDYNIDVSHDTVDRRLNEAGLHLYVARNKPFISDTNINKRLQWCIDHQNWTVAQWKRVLWCDESPFTLSYQPKQRVRRPSGKAFDKKYIKPTFKFGGGKIMVWGCFSYYGVGELYKIEGKMVCVFVFCTTKNKLFEVF